MWGRNTAIKKTLSINGQRQSCLKTFLERARRERDMLIDANTSSAGLARQPFKHFGFKLFALRTNALALVRCKIGQLDVIGFRPISAIACGDATLPRASLCAFSRLR